MRRPGHSLVLWVAAVSSIGLMYGCGKGGGGEEKKAKNTYELLTGKKPEIPKIFEENKLKFDMTAKDAQAAGFKGGKAHGDKKLEGYEPAGAIRYQVPFNATGVRFLILQINKKPEEVLKELTKKWGEPDLEYKSIISKKVKDKVWLNPETGIRAILKKSMMARDASEVAFDRYVPLAKYFGHKKKKRMGVETKKLMGMKGDEVKKVYKANMVKNMVWKETGFPSQLSFPPTELGPDPVRANIFFNKGSSKVESVIWNFQVNKIKKGKKKVMAVIEGKYGKPTSEQGKTKFYKDDKSVHVSNILKSTVSVSFKKD